MLIRTYWVKKEKEYLVIKVYYDAEKNKTEKKHERFPIAHDNS